MPDTIDINSLQAFTDSDLLTIYRYALATGGFRKTYNVNGRQVEVPDAKTCMDLIARLESRIQGDLNGPAGEVALVKFGLPTAPQDSPPTGTS